ncbi:MAG: hypothetical protein ACOH18_02110 [Candidatus Saccharimonadaceae bacterium]
MSTIEYAPIERSIFQARSVQSLVLQDLNVGEFPKAESIANPNSARLVMHQLKLLRKTPDNYLGAYIGGRLEAFIKTSDWRVADELPFATEDEREALNELSPSGELLTPRETLGIFGLVLSSDLYTGEYADIANRLLDTATDRALSLSRKAINITLHANDPVKRIAIAHGFEFTGREAEAAGAPGLVQRLYTKPLDTL